MRIECGSGFVLQGVSSAASSVDVECGVDGEWTFNLNPVSCEKGKNLANWLLFYSLKLCRSIQGGPTSAYLGKLLSKNFV